MKKLIGITLAALFVVACGKDGDIKELEKLKDEACACKDKACGEAVNKKLDEALEKMAKAYGDKEPDEATAGKMLAVMTEAGQCLAKLK